MVEERKAILQKKKHIVNIKMKEKWQKIKYEIHFWIKMKDIKR